MASGSCDMKNFAINIFTTICLILLVCVVVRAQQGTTDETVTSSTTEKEAGLSRAKISFSETLWDFGYVPKTGKVSHTYKIKNVGEDTLVIVKVRTTCGCTSAPLPKEKLAPGEIADLEVVFDPTKVAVEQTSKKVQVISNDPDQPFVEVRFSAKIGRTNSLAKITPSSLDFDTLSQRMGGVQTLTIENISGEKLSLTRPQESGENIDLDLVDRVLEPGENIQVTVRLKENTLPGNFNASFTLDFECSKVARVSVPVTAFITEE
jgi:hypothetical protein